ncbi:MAG TPA: UbiA family prenyltransferase [Candidatus Acidoferrales bacterium]|nr:UbiA family prenyltransferase [Candidatus Acidoferrales bacterium]
MNQVGPDRVQPSPTFMQKLPTLISMMRLPNCLMIGFAVIVGEFLASTLVPTRVAIYGFLAAFLLLGASMVLNDYFDREIDTINEPTRPLPAGIVKPSEALSFALILCSLGILMAAYTGIATLLIALLTIAIMISYNTRVKRTGLIGNIFVSTNVAVPFIYGGFAVGSPTWALAIFALLAFLASVGREIVKGIVDVQGDKARGVRSIAVIKGNGTAAKYGSAFFVTAVGLSVSPLLLGLVTYYYIPLVVICDFGFLLTAYSLLSNSSAGNAKRSKKFVLIWMTFGLLAFVLGSV